MISFKEFINMNEATTEISSVSSKTNVISYRPFDNNKNYDTKYVIDKIKESSFTILKGSYIRVREYGVTEAPGKSLTKNTIAELKKAIKKDFPGASYEAVLAEWIGKSGQDWNGKIWKYGGLLVSTFKIIEKE